MRYIGPTLIAASVFLSSANLRAQSDTPQTAETQIPTEAKLDPVLQQIPADAFVAFYLADTAGFLAHEGVATLLNDLPEANAILQALANLGDGSVMLAISGIPINPMTWNLHIAAAGSRDAIALQDWAELTLAEAWNKTRLAEQFGTIATIELDDGISIILPAPFVMPLTVKSVNGMVIGSTRESDFHALAGTAETGDDVPTLPAVRALGGSAKNACVLIYGDVRSVLPLASLPVSQQLPGLWEALQLDRVETLTLVEWGDKTGRRLDLAVQLTEVDAGPWRFLAPEPTELSLARFFPPRTSLLINGSLPSGVDRAEDVMAFAQRIDSAIAQEYRQELVDFQRETSLDFEKDLLANFGPEWALGGRVTRDGFSEMLLVVGIRDEQSWQAHYQSLRKTFKLESNTMPYSGYAIHRAQRAYGPLSFSFVQGALLVAAEPETIARAIDAASSDASLRSTDGYAGIARVLPRKLSNIVYVDLPVILRAAGAFDEARTGADRRALAALDRPGALAFSRNDSLVTAQFAFAGEEDISIVGTAAASIAASIRQAREQRQRVFSMSQLKGIATSCLMYAQHHKNQMPDSLDDLVADGSLTPDMLLTPYDPPEGGKQYLYRNVGDVNYVSNRSEVVIACEPTVRNGGAAFVFADGHVEWIPDPRASALIAEVRK